MSIRLHVVSDLHVEHGGFVIPPAARDLVIVAGDIAGGPRSTCEALGHLRRQVDRQDGVPIVFVPGNHEWYGADIIAGRAAATRAWREMGIIVLDGAVHRTTIAGRTIRLIGCTGWSSLTWTPDGLTGEAASRRNASLLHMAIADFHMIRADGVPFDAGHLLELHRVEDLFLAKALEDARAAGETAVPVTHVAPHRACTHPRWAADPYTPYFVDHRPHRVAGVGLWIHGHTHASVDTVAEGCRIVANPHGYGRENPDFDPGLVVTVP